MRVNLSGKKDRYRTQLWRESRQRDHPRGNLRIVYMDTMERRRGNSQVKRTERKERMQAPTAKRVQILSAVLFVVPNRLYMR